MKFLISYFKCYFIKAISTASRDQNVVNEKLIAKI